MTMQCTLLIRHYMRALWRSCCKHYMLHARSLEELLLLYWLERLDCARMCAVCKYVLASDAITVTYSHCQCRQSGRE